MMDEDKDIFKAMKEAKRGRRAGNTEKSTQILTERGVAFESKNDGSHLVVQGAGDVIDFWPSTGLWIVRANGKTESVKGRGIFNLLARLGKKG